MEMAGRLVRKLLASCPTVCGPPRKSPKISRRVGSAMARNAAFEVLCFAVTIRLLLIVTIWLPYVNTARPSGGAIAYGNKGGSESGTGRWRVLSQVLDRLYSSRRASVELQPSAPGRRRSGGGRGSASGNPKGGNGADVDATEVGGRHAYHGGVIVDENFTADHIRPDRCPYRRSRCASRRPAGAAWRTSGLVHPLCR